MRPKPRHWDSRAQESSTEPATREPPRAPQRLQGAHRIPAFSTPSAFTAWKRLQSYPLRVQLTLAVYAIAFLNGTAVHVYVILIGWQLPHHPYVTAYWTSLAVFDPLVVFLRSRLDTVSVEISR